MALNTERLNLKRSIEQEIRELERYANNPHLCFQLLRPRIIRMDDHLIETNVSQLQVPVPSAIHRIKRHSLLKDSVPKVLHS